LSKDPLSIRLNKVEMKMTLLTSLQSQLEQG